ncbi:MAG: tyrosine--tRNA ligase [Candidatus Velthaea sp.]
MALSQLSPVDAAALLADGCAHVETPTELADRIKRGRPLRVKFGIDPTGSELHIGHAVTLHKMQQFVEHGHDVTLLIGDSTALIGDPTGRNDSRPPLTREMIAENMKSYVEQAGRVLDMERVTVRYNSEWLDTLSYADMIRLMTQVTVAQMLGREDFRSRYTGEVPISLHEFLYPVAQAYDSVALKADVELGGDDQLFNFLLARTYQANAGQPSQICMTLPILEGTDGKIRMGKSKGNYIAIAESAREQFGKVMSIPDDLIARWARLVDFRSIADCERLQTGIESGSLAPMDEKKKLGEAIVARYHDAAAARDARDYFERTIQRKEVPSDIPERTLGNDDKIIDLVLAAGFAESKRAAQRLIAEGAVKVDGVPVTDPQTRWSANVPAVLQVGSRRFVRILPRER